MRQLLHPRCSALRTIIAATIMIIANATTAWADLSFTIVTEPPEAGVGGTYIMHGTSGREFTVIPYEGFCVKSVFWSDEGNPAQMLYETVAVGDSYYSAPMASGEVVITFEMKNGGTCGQTSSDKVYWAISNDGTVLYINGRGEMANYVDSYNTPWWQNHETIKTIVVNDGVSTIGDNAFAFFSALTSVSLPNSLTSIGERAFGESTMLTSIDIPANVSILGKQVFKSCTRLKTVNIYATTPPELGDGAFDDNASDRKIYVPRASLDDYKSADGWSDYKDDILPYVGVLYIDADGNEVSCEKFTALNGSEDKLTNNVDTDGDGTLDQGWYVVNFNISYPNAIALDGDIHLILCDGKKMSVSGGDVYSFHDFSSENGANLTIYGQTNQTGRLEAYSEVTNNILLNDGNYTQYGGDVYLSNTCNIGSCALVAFTENVVDHGNVTLCRGKLTISDPGDDGTAIGAYNNVNILGGQLDARGGIDGEDADGEDADGISTYVGNITLGWTTDNDRIKASSYHAGGTVKIVKGQALVDQDESTNYAVGDDNALSDDALSAFAGKTLKPALLLTDNADNSAQVAALDEFETTAILQGRTLYRDDDWNTLCLPFNVSTASGPLSGNNVEAKVLRPSDSGLSGTTLTLNFDNASEPILAGTPFIVKWDNTGENITNPVFQDVTIDNSADAIARMTQPSTDGTVSFKGTYAWQEYDEENQSILLLGTNNQLFWPKPDGNNKPSIGACRAYFELSDGTSAREFVLYFGEVETSSLPQPLQKEGSQNAAWYTLDGRKLDGQKPIAKGMYIVNGRKVIIK